MIRKFSWLRPLLALLLATPLMASASAPAYDAIYVFGDSYCDVGNIYLATSGAIPSSPPYFQGHFSNGPIWVEHVAGYLGLPMKPYLAGGTDYAFGGAWMTAPQVTPEGTIPSVPQQVALYLSLHGGKADPKALYVIEGGGNDILGTTSGSADALGFKIATGIAESELLLRRAGAHNFLIPNLINVGALPAAAANAAFATAASDATNSWLNKLLGLESFLEGIRILRVDVFSLLSAVKTDPFHFGFVNITTPCLNPITGAVCSDPDHTFFWDVEHPTEFGHAFFAVTTETVLSAQNQ
jgi:outer membrane lipase/esterase